jgi:hypothetical protein
VSMNPERKLPAEWATWTLFLWILYYEELALAVCYARWIGIPLSPWSTPLAYSPWIVATNVRRWELFRNSQRYIPCHVPRANLPPDIGTETLVPVNTDLICAGYSN